MNRKKLIKKAAKLLADHGPLTDIGLHKQLQDAGIYIPLAELQHVLHLMNQRGMTKPSRSRASLGIRAQARQDLEIDEEAVRAEIRQLLAEEGYEGVALETAFQLRLDMIALLRANGPMSRDIVIAHLEATGWKQEYLEAEVPQLSDLAEEAPNLNRTDCRPIPYRGIQYAYVATDQATEVLGGVDGVKQVASEITGLLVKAKAFDQKRVNLAFFQRSGQRLLAVNRHDVADGMMKTEISVLDENYGGYARCLAQTMLDQLTPVDRQAATTLHPIDPDSEDAIIGISQSYELVSLARSIVIEGERDSNEA